MPYRVIDCVTGTPITIICPQSATLAGDQEEKCGLQQFVITDTEVRSNKTLTF